MSPNDDSALSLWSEDSILSIGSKGSVLSSGSRDSILGHPGRANAGLLSAGVLIACGLAIAGWAIYRR